MTGAPLLSRIHHVAYRCRDAMETVEWYGRVLGMTYTTAFAEDHVPSTGAYDPYMHVFLDCGGGNVLAFFELPRQPDMSRDPNTPEWVQHIAFEVADEAALLAAKEHAEAHGVSVLGPTWHGIFKSIYFFDPNGHRIELACNIGTPEQLAELKRLAPEMLEEWSRTKRAPRHAEWLHQGTQGIMQIDHTHAADASSWVPGADEHAHFPVQNLPVGVFSHGEGGRRIGCAIGDWILDLAALANEGSLPDEASHVLASETLNALFGLPGTARRELRHAVFALLTAEQGRERAEGHLHRAADCTLHLPFRVGDYTDFYVGIHHATNIGRLFRPDNPLLPNYKHVPIGYHGRASSVRVSGTPAFRPKGQLKPADAAAPVFAPSERLDYELELGVWIAGHNDLGRPVAIGDAWSRVGGLCLLNDWSARDIQAWEYQPLGPFLAKNFLTTVSSWVVTSDALAPFRIAQQTRPAGDPEPLPYLVDEADRRSGALALKLEVSLSTAAMRDAAVPPHRLSAGPAGNMYWTVAQMVAHHTSNGCDLHAGDLLGTGTISGPERESFGSLIELSAGGKEPIVLPSGEERRFLGDHDQVHFTATAVRDGFRSIGFGDCWGEVLPAGGH